MKRVHFPEFNQSVTVSQNSTVLDAALEAKINISHSCGGNGTCGTCLILIQKGLENCSPRNEIEREMAEDRGFGEHERLSCQLQFSGEITVLKGNSFST